MFASARAALQGAFCALTVGRGVSHAADHRGTSVDIIRKSRFHIYCESSHAVL